MHGAEGKSKRVNTVDFISFLYKAMYHRTSHTQTIQKSESSSNQQWTAKRPSHGRHISRPNLATQILSVIRKPRAPKSSLMEEVLDHLLRRATSQLQKMRCARRIGSVLISSQSPIRLWGRIKSGLSVWSGGLALLLICSGRNLFIGYHGCSTATTIIWFSFIRDCIHRGGYFETMAILLEPALGLSKWHERLCKFQKWSLHHSIFIHLSTEFLDCYS